MQSHQRFIWLVTATALVTATGCANWKKRDQGAAIGAGAGAAIGGIIGKHQGSTAKGAIIGAVIGGAAGAIIGHQMDQQAKELQQNIPGAKVERVGEGIQVTFDSGILFDFDSDVVKGNAQSNLSTLASSLGKYPGSNVVIIGHTDDTGADTYNQGLSERRAASAANALVSSGVSRDRLRPMGLGETEPVTPNDSDASRAKNRRVEVAIFASDKQVLDAKRQVPLFATAGRRKPAGVASAVHPTSRTIERACQPPRLHPPRRLSLEST
jgi:outer membrane protein OmpA-like peptidoglycan-associated protein